MIEPTGYTALDLVGFTDKGTYAANVNYVKNDLVHHGGNIWRVLIDDTIGITPAEGPNYTIFMGEPINLVERIIAPLEGNPATVAYQTGRQIIYNDHLYEVIQNIGVGDILIAYEDDPTNANIKLASPVETQVLALNASKVNKSDVVNNVTTTAKGKVLDARQGKVLQDGINTKVNKSDIANNVTTTAEGKVLDARQGKALQDGINTKVNTSDIANNVTTTTAGKVLDARQGKALQDGKTDNSVIAPVESGTTASRAYAAGAHFIKNGAFCTAITAIAQGETFTLNTNYTAGNIGDRVEDLENDKTGFINVNARRDIVVGTPVTVSYDAWVYLHLYMQPNTTLVFKIDNIKVYEYYEFSSAGNANMLIPVKKGQTISVTSTDTSQTGNQAGSIFRMY